MHVTANKGMMSDGRARLRTRTGFPAQAGLG